MAERIFELLQHYESCRGIPDEKDFAGACHIVQFSDVGLCALRGPSTWTNQHGSVLKVTSLSRGTFRAVFINRNPDFGCLGIPYPVTGTNFGVQVTFTVNFAKCKAVVKWQGNVSGFGMSTQWVMQRNGATTWGFDFFGRG